MTKMKKIAAMTAALLISASTLGYMPQDSIKISNVTANAAEEETTSVEINEANFPDSIFRQYVAEEFDINGDSVLSDKEIAAVTKIDVYDMGISDLTGIEYFENLAILECMFNKLTTLDISKNTALIELNCYHNQLTSLDVSDHTELIILCFDSNNITSIDLSNNTALTELSCSATKLTSIDISNNTALTRLYCYDGQLTSLDISKNTALETLRCMSNQLTSLDVSNNTALTRLFCYNNQLTSLDISKNTALKTLWCMENQFTSLDLSNNTALEALRAEDNKYEIALTDNTFDLSTLPTGFDVSKASDWTNATVEGNILTIEDVTKAVTYKYDFGNEHSEVFTLVPPKTETPATTTTAANTTNPTTTTTTFAPPSYSCSLNVYPYDEADTIYEIGEELDYSTICVHGYGTMTSFGSTTYMDIPYISLDRCNLTVDASEFDNTKPGTYTIYVEWYNAKDSFEVTVIDPDNPTAIPGVEINETNFPDAIFRKYVAKNFDKNTDGRLSDKEIAAVTSLHLYEMGISDLTGIQHFENLQILSCGENNLTQLDISENTALTDLYCEYNNLTTLDTSNNVLLCVLDCHKNKLTKLDFSNNPELAALWCSNNQLTSLDVSNNTMLYDLACDNNQLASIDLSNTICKEISDWGLLLSKNKHKITITDNTFDLSKLPSGFDVTKASKWTNATVEGNILTIEDVTKEVTYTYDCGLGFSETFTLIPQIAETPDETTTAPKTTATTTTTTATAMFTTTTFAPPSYSCSLSVYPYDEADTIYEIGEELDYSTICVHGYGTMTSFGSTTYMDIPYISLDRCNLTVDASEFDNTKPGTYTIYVEWYNAKDSFEVTVIDPDNPTAIPGVEINETNFPDSIFRQYIAEKYDDDNDGTLSYDEMINVTQLLLRESGVSDLTGLQYFKNLAILDCAENNLTQLDISENTALTHLYCSDNNLTNLDISNNVILNTLSCYNNKLTKLDLSSNSELGGVWCSNNQLTSLDVSHNTLLTDLLCSNNQLASVDLSNTICIKNGEWGTVLNGNKHKIALTNNTFDLSTLPAGFDVSKASDWTNATVEGNILTIEDVTKEVTYTYDCGLGFSETFTLIPQIAETPAETTTTTAAPETTITTTAITTVTTTTAALVTTTTPDEDLPQTGFSNLYNCIPVSAGALVLLGMYAVKKSRKEDEE